jgi:hypothetical protein
MASPVARPMMESSIARPNRIGKQSADRRGASPKCAWSAFWRRGRPPLKRRLEMLHRPNRIAITDGRKSYVFARKKCGLSRRP